MKLSEILTWSAQLAGCDSVPADSQVYVESAGDVRKVLFGVDIDAGELLFAQQAGYDAVIAHHPVGDRADLDFPKVVHRQVEQMAAEGISRDVAEQAVESRLGTVRRTMHKSNINRVVDTARLIGVPFANIHLACDIIGRQVIVDLLAERADAAGTVADAVALLDAIPEIEAGWSRPEVWCGEPTQRLGRYTVAMAGGTNGGYPVFKEYFAAGVDTIFAMHIAEDDLQRLRKDPASEGHALVVTGHMATDSIGINAVIRGMEEHGIEVTRTSGIIPV